MQVIESIADLRTVRRALSGTLGFVPTMGFLHAGHLALVERAAQENAHVAVSIFVNPTQFGVGEDFAGYPRDTERDLALLRGAGMTLVFMPLAAEIYPPGFQSFIEVSEVSAGLEGERRPGHFRGVATVVGKLFNLLQPDRAYFGQKDAQQVAVIRRMVIDLNYPLDVVVVPTRRAEDGLALSSRNTNLSEPERAAAPVLYWALQAAQSAYRQGAQSADSLRTLMVSVLANEPLANIEYVSAADAETLRELNGALDSRPVLLSLAVRIGRTRLIDNVVLASDGQTQYH